MKLDAGQLTEPVPWPTHSNPISTAAIPNIRTTDFIATAVAEPSNVRNGWKAGIGSSLHLQVKPVSTPTSGGDCGAHMKIGPLTIWMVLAACASTPTTAQMQTSQASPYLLILASDKDGAEEDFFPVVDVRSDSPTRGKAIATRPYGHRKSMPHHLEYSLPKNGELLFANAHHPELTMLVDVSEAPSITIKKAIKPPSPFRFTHDYARLPNGNVLVGFLRSEGPSPKAEDRSFRGVMEVLPNKPPAVTC